GAAPRRRSRPGPARDPQRQPDVDQRERRCAAEDARATDDEPPPERVARERQAPPAARWVSVAVPQALGRASEGHVRPFHAVRGIQLPLLRPDRRSRSADAAAYAGDAE